MVDSMALNIVRAKPNEVRQGTFFRRILWIFLLAITAAIALAGIGGLFAGLEISQGDFEVVEQANGRIIKVPAGGNLQATIDRARGGDTIELAAGATYKGAFRLPNIPGSDFVTIRTSAPDSQLPPADTRLDPAKYQPVLPRIVSNVTGEPAILAINGAHHFRFIGIEFGPTIDGLYNIIQLGSTDEKRVEDLPHHIEFDRVYIHGSPTQGQRRGIAANGRHIKIINSHFSDFKREGEESQAIAVWAADGPLEIVNNYLEAAAESILFGGATSDLGIVPGNAIVRDNWLNKPIEWRSTKWVVKNFLEIKSGQNIKIENNLMTNNWAMAQEGTGVVFRTADDSGKQSFIRNVEFNNNIMRGSGSAITVYGGEAAGGRDLTIRNNVFEDITSKKWDGRGFFLKPSTWDGLVVENNTVIHDGSITIAYGEPIRRFVFRNNIVFNNEYGFFGDGVGVGKVAIGRYFPGSIITNNIIVGGSPSDFGGSNYYPASLAQIGISQPSKGDYRLRNESPFLTRGLGGKQIGANLDPSSVGGKLLNPLSDN